jgi:hypothetical protein
MFGQQANEEDEGRHGSAYDVGQRCVTAWFCNSNESRPSVRSSSRPARKMRADVAVRMMCATGRFCNAYDSGSSVRSSSRPASRMRAVAAARMNVG